MSESGMGRKGSAAAYAFPTRPFRLPRLRRLRVPVSSQGYPFSCLTVGAEVSTPIWRMAMWLSRVSRSL